MSRGDSDPSNAQPIPFSTVIIPETALGPFPTLLSEICMAPTVSC